MISRKVYSILMVQLAITGFFITLFVTSKSTSAYFAKNPQYVIIAFVVTFICMICMACCEGPRRTAPTNYIFLFVFTLAESFLLGVISAAYKLETVSLSIFTCNFTRGPCRLLLLKESGIFRRVNFHNGDVF